MGRLPLESFRVSCRINKTAGRVLTEALSRVEWPAGKPPTGTLLSRLILKTSPETWESVLSQFPKGRPFRSHEQRRRRAARLAREEKEWVDNWSEGSHRPLRTSISGTVANDRGKRTTNVRS